MTPFELAVCIIAVVGGSAGIAYAIYLDRVSGRGRPRDPERLKTFIRNAPYDRLNNMPAE